MCSRSMTVAGVNRRKIKYIAMDDAYSPPKAVEHARKLVERDGVSFIFGQLWDPRQFGDGEIPQGQGRSLDCDRQWLQQIHGHRRVSADDDWSGELPDRGTNLRRVLDKALPSGNMRSFSRTMTLARTTSAPSNHS